MSVSEFRKLETLVLRKIEKDTATRQDMSFSFETTLKLTNGLLDNVEIVRGANFGFEIKDKSSGEIRAASALSRGKSELISLAIEILAFAYSAENHSGKTSYLFLTNQTYICIQICKNVWLGYCLKPSPAGTLL